MKATPHWIVRLFMGVTFAGLMGTAATFLIPAATVADVGESAGFTRTAAIIVTAVALLGAVVSDALLKKGDPKA